MTTRKQMWNDDIRLVIAILQEQFHIGEVIMDAAEYGAKYRKMLEAAGPELTFLQLATLDKKSPLGWKPTPLLMELVAERKAAKKAKRLYEADIWFQLMDDYVYGYKATRGQGGVFTRELLIALGLLREWGLSDWVTYQLHALFNNAYFDKRARDGLQPCPELPPSQYQVVVQPQSSKVS